MSVKAELIEFTGKGRPDESWHAAHLLVFTKGTRLMMSPRGLSEVAARPIDQVVAELDAMSKTIPSSWEFVDVTFLVSGITRATAQQMTRTRTGSYAMQSQRATDLSEVEITNPLSEDDPYRRVYDEAILKSRNAYAVLINAGVEPQDARGVLPINTQCNLVAKYNLRAFVDLVKARSSLRTQGEYHDVVDQMVDAVTAVWPWAKLFLRRPKDLGCQMIEDIIKRLQLKVGDGTAWELAKALDLLRKGENE